MNIQDSSKEIMRQYDKLSLITAIILMVLMSVVYFIVDIYLVEEWATFIKSLILNLIPILITFFISYAVFRKVLSIKQKQNIDEISMGIKSELIPELKELIIKSDGDGRPQLHDFNEIDWKQILSNGLRVDIFVHYFDTWVRNNSEILQKILDRGGKIRCIIPDYEDESLVKQVKRRFPEYEEPLIKAKIEGTKEKLLLLKNDTSHKEASLEVYLTDELGYYCGIRVNDNLLSLSLYDHVREKRRIESPTFLIDLSKNEKVSLWFEKEFVKIAGNSKRIV